MTKQQMKKLENQIRFNEEQAKRLEELGEKEKAMYWKGRASAENNTQVWYNEDRDIFISEDINACFQQYALEYQESLDELYNNGVFDEEIQILKSEGIQYPQIWQCVKYIVEVDENASLHLTKLQNLYVLKVID